MEEDLGLIDGVYKVLEDDLDREILIVVSQDKKFYYRTRDTKLAVFSNLFPVFSVHTTEEAVALIGMGIDIDSKCLEVSDLIEVASQLRQNYYRMKSEGF